MLLSQLRSNSACLILHYRLRNSDHTNPVVNFVGIFDAVANRMFVFNDAYLHRTFCTSLRSCSIHFANLHFSLDMQVQ